jgi:chromosome segregation ATPase
MRQQLQEAAVNTKPPSPEPLRKPELQPRSWSSPTASSAGPQLIERPEPAPDDVLAGLAQSVSQAVVSAVAQLEHRRNEEKHALERAVRDQDQRLTGALERIAEMQSRFDKLTRILEEQQNLARSASDTFERLSGEIAEIHRRDAGRERVLEELRRETLDLSVSVSDRQDQTAGRMDLQQADIESLKSEVAQLKPIVEQVSERLRRHSQAIRAVFEAERRREESLERLTEAASSLKASTLRYPEGLSEELL